MQPTLHGAIYLFTCFPVYVCWMYIRDGPTEKGWGEKAKIMSFIMQGKRTRKTFVQRRRQRKVMHLQKNPARAMSEKKSCKAKIALMVRSSGHKLCARRRCAYTVSIRVGLPVPDAQLCSCLASYEFSPFSPRGVLQWGPIQSSVQ